MKKIIACLALLIVVNSIHSQQSNPSPVLTKKDYLQKSKNQKTAAWLFTGGGMIITGLGISDGDASGGKSENSRKTVLIVTGLAAIGVGITLFISATTNKKRAESLSFRMEKAPLIQQGGFVYHSYPALSFRLNL
jgi:hypothetical protein